MVIFPTIYFIYIEHIVAVSAVAFRARARELAGTRQPPERLPPFFFVLCFDNIVGFLFNLTCTLFLLSVCDADPGRYCLKQENPYGSIQRDALRCGEILRGIPRRNQMIPTSAD
jgi:hypothetical protein